MSLVSKYRLCELANASEAAVAVALEQETLNPHDAGPVSIAAWGVTKHYNASFSAEVIAGLET
ncbi:hypothetical protein [Pseudomonas amygdali]|nr:hypothetical protein [Pseudomonas amygdali]